MTKEDPQNANVEQIRPQDHPALVQHLTGRRPPGVLAVVIAQPTAKDKHRPAEIGVDVVKKDVQELYHFGPPALTSTYCGATSWLKRR
ncbi:hypothetical protein SDC9_172662 [bioreactor metagenome]|uniref:Uncharacterized protein n=1 Tax=bioreactor metagenome TaxID=1076179 RepID=A0A645GEY5_9ZZZZ